MEDVDNSLYSPTQNIADNLENITKNDMDDSKKINNKKPNKNKPKKSKDKVKTNLKEKSLKSKSSSKGSSKNNEKRKSIKKKSQSSSISKSRSSSESKSSCSPSQSSQKSSSNSKSSTKSRSRSRDRHRRSRSHSNRRHNDHQRVHRGESRRGLRRSRSRTDGRQKYISEDPYRYQSPVRPSRDFSRRDYRQSDNSFFERTIDREGGDGRGRRDNHSGRGGERHGRGSDGYGRGGDRNSWKKERLENYRENDLRSRHWDKSQDRYKERHDRNIDKNLDIDKEHISRNGQYDKGFIDSNKNKPVEENQEKSISIVQNHFEKINDSLPPDNKNIVESNYNEIHKSLTENIEIQNQPNIPMNTMPMQLTFSPRPPPPVFQQTFMDPRSNIVDQSQNMIQIRQGIPFNSNQPQMGQHNQQFRIVGPPRQQGGFVFRPVHIVEQAMDWRMDIRHPVNSQPSRIPLPPNIPPSIPPNNTIYRGHPLEMSTRPGNRILLPIPPPPMQIMHSRMHLEMPHHIIEPRVSSPPPPPPPVQYILNTAPGMPVNRFPQQMMMRQPGPEIIHLNYNPNVPPPTLPQFIPNPQIQPLPERPTSPQTPLQSEATATGRSPSPDENNDMAEEHYSPYSMTSDVDNKYDAYHDALFVDNFKRKSQSKSVSPASPASPCPDEPLEESIAPKSDIVKPAAPEQTENKLATIAPFCIGNPSKPAVNNSKPLTSFEPLRPVSPIKVKIPGFSDSVADSLEQLTSLLNSAGMKPVNFKQPDLSSFTSLLSNESPMQDELDIPLDLAAKASQQTIELARQLGLFELTKTLEEATRNNEASIKNDLPTKKTVSKNSKKEPVPNFDKLSRIDRIAEEVKLALKPHFAKNVINKEDYKDIMRKAVPKISGSKSELDQSRIKAFVHEYVQKIYQAKKMAKSEQKKFTKQT